MGFVQSATGTSTSSTTVAATFSANTTANDYIIVGISNYVAGTSPTVSSISCGSITFQRANRQNGTAEGDAEIWYGLDSEGGNKTVTVTFTGSGTDNQVVIVEWNGIADVSPLDKAPTGASGSDASTFTSNSTGTLSQASEVAFGVVVARVGSGTETITGPSNPWTNISATSTATVEMLLGYQQVDATTALTYSGSTTAASVNSACIATFELAAGIQVALPVVETTDNVPPLPPPIYVYLPVVETTDNVPDVSPQSPVQVFLPLVHTSNDLYAVTAEEPQELIIAICPLQTTDPLDDVECVPGFTSFQPVATNGVYYALNLTAGVLQWLISTSQQGPWNTGEAGISFDFSIPSGATAGPLIYGSIGTAIEDGPLIVTNGPVEINPASGEPITNTRLQLYYLDGVFYAVGSSGTPVAIATT